MTLICVLGDAHLDVVARPAGPVARETDTPSRNWVGVGGQASQRRGLGLRARWPGPADRGPRQRSRRQPGGRGNWPSRGGCRRAGARRADRGHRVLVRARHVPVHADRPGRGAVADQKKHWPVPGSRTADLLHLPAYSLVREPIGSAAREAAARVPRLSIDLSSTAVLRTTGPAGSGRCWRELRPQVVFGTEAEADLVGDVPGADLVVKLGARGVRAAGVVYPAAPVRRRGPDRSGRRVRGRLPGRRGQPRPGRGGPGGGHDGSDALMMMTRRSHRG